MSARTSQRGTIVPVRDAAREAASSGSSEVKTWKMSPEELEDYRARTGYKAPTDIVGKEISPPVQHRSPMFSSEEQSRRAKSGRKPAEGPDQKAFLTSIAAGKTITAIETELGMKRNSLYYWVKKWGFTGIAPGKARTILNGETLEEEVENVNDGKVVPVEAKVEALNEMIVSYEGEIARLLQVDSENTVRLTEITEDRDQWHHQSIQYKKSAAQFELERNEALQAIAELEEEKHLLLATLQAAAEDAIEQVFENDNVNHPAHYTAGGIECIDAIEAALAGITGPHAYSTGAAIKYLWRWSHKNGIEDLQKAVWYVNRLIGKAEA